MAVPAWGNTDLGDLQLECPVVSNTGCYYGQGTCRNRCSSAGRTDIHRCCVCGGSRALHLDLNLGSLLWLVWLADLWTGRGLGYHTPERVADLGRESETWAGLHCHAYLSPDVWS